MHMHKGRRPLCICMANSKLHFESCTHSKCILSGPKAHTNAFCILSGPCTSAQAKLRFACALVHGPLKGPAPFASHFKWPFGRRPKGGGPPSHAPNNCSAAFCATGCYDPPHPSPHTKLQQKKKRLRRFFFFCCSFEWGEGEPLFDNKFQRVGAMGLRPIAPTESKGRFAPFGGPLGAKPPKGLALRPSSAEGRWVPHRA